MMRSVAVLALVSASLLVSAVHADVVMRLGRQDSDNDIYGPSSVPEPLNVMPAVPGEENEKSAPEAPQRGAPHFADAMLPLPDTVAAEPSTPESTPQSPPQSTRSAHLADLNIPAPRHKTTAPQQQQQQQKEEEKEAPSASSSSESAGSSAAARVPLKIAQPLGNSDERKLRKDQAREERHDTKAAPGASEPTPGPGSSTGPAGSQPTREKSIPPPKQSTPRPADAPLFVDKKLIQLGHEVPDKITQSQEKKLTQKEEQQTTKFLHAYVPFMITVVVVIAVVMGVMFQKGYLSYGARRSYSGYQRLPPDAVYDDFVAV